jgi:CheY-like chemotaxis protein
MLAAAGSRQTKARRGTVLVVDDDELVSLVVTEVLEWAGFDVQKASSGDEALSLMDALTTFDVLLTDIRMPGKTDGWTLAERAREQHPDLAVIYLSAYSPDPPRAVTGSIFLRKPYRTEVLLQTLRQLGFSPLH